MRAIYFVNKFDQSTMTDLEIVRITAIYKDENEISVRCGFECSSASEGVRGEAKRVERERMKSWFEVSQEGTVSVRLSFNAVLFQARDAQAI